MVVIWVWAFSKCEFFILIFRGKTCKLADRGYEKQTDGQT